MPRSKHGRKASLLRRTHLPRVYYSTEDWARSNGCRIYRGEKEATRISAKKFSWKRIGGGKGFFGSIKLEGRRWIRLF